MAETAILQDLGVVTGREPSTLKQRLTSIQVSIWQMIQLCFAMLYEGMALADSGTGKTDIATRWRQKHGDTVFLSAGVIERALGALLCEIAEQVGANYYATNAVILYDIIDRLQEHPRLIIVDECHLLTWKQLEALREVHDKAGVGIAYLGQPRFLDQMQRNRGSSFLYDQILGRMAVRRVFRNAILKDDVRIVAESFCPGLEKKALNFLHKKAQLDGKFRIIRFILEVSIETANMEGKPVDLNLISRVCRSLGI